MECGFSFYNNSLSFNLKQTMNTVDDLLYNMQSLKQLQCNIDCIQAVKDKAQIQVNMTALALLRVFLLNEPGIGIILFRNLVRRFYQLNDERIVRYEKIKNINCKSAKQMSVFEITNEHVLKRKGADFVLNGCRYVKDTSLIEYFKYDWDCDFHNHPNLKDGLVRSISYRNAIMENEFTQWDWDLVKDIYKGIEGVEPSRGGSLFRLLDNRGFLAQLGIDNIENVFDKLQEITGSPLSNEVMDNAKQEYELYRFELNSYLSLSKEFIILHQGELDWRVLQRNPRISWDLELINLLLKQIRNTVNESEWNEALQGSRAMYAAIDNLLNDEILSDIEKLYDV